MLMQTVSLYDTLELIKSDSSAFILDDILQDDPGKNLAWRAFEAIRSYTGSDIKAVIKLNKRIPSAAGLGGGSSDCAGVLQAINTLFGLNISTNEMNKIAVSLGADVPFFLQGGLCRVKGIGEDVERIRSTAKFPLLIVHCGGGLSTPAVYKKYDCLLNDAIQDYKLSTTEVLRSISSGKIRNLRELGLNHLEAPAVCMMPEIAEVKRRMYACGAVFSQMSGSGSAVYGIFDTKKAALEAAGEFPGSFFCETIS